MTKFRSLLLVATAAAGLAGCTAESGPSAPTLPADGTAPAPAAAPVVSGGTTKQVESGPGAFQIE
jgi:hypothetical protein